MWEAKVIAAAAAAAAAAADAAAETNWKHKVTPDWGDLKSRNSGMRCPIDKEQKKDVSGPNVNWIHFLTFNSDLTHDLDLEFSTSNFEIDVSQEWEG